MVGAAWARIEKQCPFCWNVALRPDGEPFDSDDLPYARVEDDSPQASEEVNDSNGESREEGTTESQTLVDPDGPGALVPRSSGNRFVPTMMTIWVHPTHRRKGVGRQLVAALATHFRLPIEEIGFRLPLWRESVHMGLAMGLRRIVACL